MAALKEVRFGTVGTNFIVDEFLRVASSLPDFRLTAVYSRTAERAAAFVAKHTTAPPAQPLVATFTSLEALAACTDVDAVYIASPTSEHARQAMLLLRAGKHVLCEKPACSHAEELAEVLAVAREAGRAFMEAMRPLKTPQFAAVRAHLVAFAEQGSPVRHFAGSFCQLSSRWPAYLRGERPNAFRPDLSNGALMDLGCYAIYSAVALLGVPDGVSYTPLMLPTGVDGAGTVVMTYADTAIATLVISKMSHGWNYSELQTDAGTVRIGNLGDYDEVQLHTKGSPPKLLGPHGLAGHSNMVYEVAGFVAMVQAGRLEDDILTWDLALAVARVMDRARDSAGIVFPADKNRV